ncbi:MAG: trypsin-like peptidase domain-containing protein [Clostridia bacterium]|nr:trypsin-like peptidase domain-containing protein [Clostridia bacterium]
MTNDNNELDNGLWDEVINENKADEDLSGGLGKTETEASNMPWYAQPSSFEQNARESEKSADEITSAVHYVENSFADSINPPTSSQRLAGTPPTSSNYYNPYASSSASAQSKSKKQKKYISQGVFFTVIAGMLVLFILASAIIAAFSSGAGRKILTRNNEDTAISVPTVTINDTPVTDTKVYDTDTILTPAQVAALIKPSVVSVITYDTSVFGTSQSQGSGIIYNSDGYIITNSHVVGDTKNNRVTVILADGDKEYQATVLGYDTTTDLAVLKIDEKNLTAAEFGKSESLVTGDMVLAVGNPGGIQLAGSVSVGYVSGINRVIDGDGTSSSAMKYIQTDAAINPGNSGGALVNMYGEVVGINTAKISGADYEGLGFAIPITTAKPIVEDLVAYGYVTGRVKLGISCYEISSSMSYYYSIPEGLYVQTIDADSDLNGKVQVGEIITKINGKAVSTVSDVQDITNGMNAGDTVTLTVYSGATQLSKARTYEVKVKLIADKGDSQSEQTVPSTPSNPGNGAYGGNGGNYGGFGDLFDYFFGR